MHPLNLAKWSAVILHRASCADMGDQDLNHYKLRCLCLTRACTASLSLVAVLLTRDGYPRTFSIEGVLFESSAHPIPDILSDISLSPRNGNSLVRAIG